MKRYPTINDVTTTPESPPHFFAMPAATSNKYTKAAEKAGIKHYGDIRPLEFAVDGPTIVEKAKKVLMAMGLTDIRFDDQSMCLQAVATTKLFRFKDDFLVRIEKKGEGCTMHVRSKSRLGKGDLGANYLRIKEFLRQMQ